MDALHGHDGRRAERGIRGWPTTARGPWPHTYTVAVDPKWAAKYGGYILCPQRNSKKMNDKLVGPRPLHKQFTVEQASAFDIAQLDAENWPIRESSWEAVGKMSEKVMKQDQLRYMIAGRMKIVRRGFMGIHLLMAGRVRRHGRSSRVRRAACSPERCACGSSHLLASPP